MKTCWTYKNVWRLYVLTKSTFFDMCSAVSAGVCPVDLSLRNPGVIKSFQVVDNGLSYPTSVCCKSKSIGWTQGPRFLHEQSMPPCGSKLNTALSCKDGVRHVYNTILKSRYLTDDLKKVIDPVIQRNAFFSHPENFNIVGDAHWWKTSYTEVKFNSYATHH